MTSASAGPCFRFSRSSSASRSSTSCSRAGEASMPSPKSRSVNASSSSCALMPSRLLEVGHEPRVECPPAPPPVSTHGPAGQHRVLVVVQLGVAFLAEPLDAIGAAQDLPFARRALRPLRLERGLLELAQLELHELEPRRALAAVHAEPVELLAECAALGQMPQRRCVAERSSLPKASSTGRCCAGIEQLLVLVLPVELDQPVRQVLERRRGGQRAVDEGAAPALRRDFAANDQLRCCRRLRRWLRRWRCPRRCATRSWAARPPSSRPTASTRMDLPAPVSPVRMLNGVQTRRTPTR